MKVSIIIPVFNIEEYIERSLTSALNQDYNDIEIIIVNDCTLDNSLAIIESIISKHQRGNIVKVISHKVNQGLSAARNSGINESTGDFLYFFDGDDEITIDCISHLVSYLAIDPNLELIVGNFNPVGFNTSLDKLKCEDCIKNNSKGFFSFHKYIYVMAWNKLIKKSFIIDNKLYFKSGLIYEDMLWSFCIATVNKSIAVTNKVTYIYYNNLNSIMNNLTSKSAYSLLEIVKYKCKWIIDNNFNDNNLILHNYEYTMVVLFRRFIISGYNVADCFKLYKDLRNLRPTYMTAFANLSLSSLRLFIRSLHYFLPPKIGFKYIFLLENKISIIKKIFKS